MTSVKRAASSVALVAAVAGSGVAAASSASAFTPQPTKYPSTCMVKASFVGYPTLYYGQVPYKQSAAETRLNGPGCEYNTLHSSIANVQRKLGINADGFFGAQTRTSVMNFQRSHHLGVDGVVGPATLRALKLSYIVA